MKKLMIFIVAVFSFALNAQVADTVKVAQSDTTTIAIGKTKIIIIGEDFEEESDSIYIDDCEDDLTWWNGIDVGVNGFIYGDEFDFEVPEGQEYFELNERKSIYVSVNLFETKLDLIKEYVGITTGLGFQFYSYEFQKGYTLGIEGDSIVAFIDSTISLRKNQLNTSYVVVPLMLEFNTSKRANRSFHISAGVIGGWNMANRYRQKFKVIGTDQRSKLKVKSRWDIAPIKLDAAARIGYGDFTFFGTYALTDMFRSQDNPQIRPFSAGLSLNF